MVVLLRSRRLAAIGAQGLRGRRETPAPDWDAALPAVMESRPFETVSALARPSAGDRAARAFAWDPDMQEAVAATAADLARLSRVRGPERYLVYMPVEADYRPSAPEDEIRAWLAAMTRSEGGGMIDHFPAFRRLSWPPAARLFLRESGATIERPRVVEKSDARP